MASKVVLDIQVVHQDDIGDEVGEFFGSPIFSWDSLDSQRRIDVDRERFIALGQHG